MPDVTPSDIRPLVIVLVGLPGSGKSTWAHRHGGAVLSSDQIRFLLADDETNQSVHREVFATLRYVLRRRLELRRPVTFVDATNLTLRERRPYIRLAQMYGSRVEAVFFDVPVEVCKERNRSRDRVVPDEAIDYLASRLAIPDLAEGFDAISTQA